MLDSILLRALHAPAIAPQAWAAKGHRITGGLSCQKLPDTWNQDFSLHIMIE